MKAGRAIRLRRLRLGRKHRAWRCDLLRLRHALHQGTCGQSMQYAERLVTVGDGLDRRNSKVVSEAKSGSLYRYGCGHGASSIHIGTPSASQSIHETSCY